MNIFLLLNILIKVFYGKILFLCWLILSQPTLIISIGDLSFIDEEVSRKTKVSTVKTLQKVFIVLIATIFYYFIGRVSVIQVVYYLYCFRVEVSI